MQLPIQNRRVAGRDLAALLHGLRHRADVIVLGLPCGGIPIAYEIAQALDAELDVLVPQALTRDDAAPPDAEQGRALMRLERMLRGNRARPRLRKRTVILADDGMTEGVTMGAAVEAVYREEPARIIVAVPVADSVTLNLLRPRVAECVVLTTPQPLRAVAPFYRDFTAIEEVEAQRLLRGYWSRRRVKAPDQVPS